MPEETDSEEYLRLVLNSLHFLAKGTRPKRLLQSLTELRMLAIAGYMPDLVACADCAAYESDVMYFLPDSGVLRCKDCFADTGEPYVALPPGVLTAMRHIVFSDFEKLYAFSLPEPALRILNAATEKLRGAHAAHDAEKRWNSTRLFWTRNACRPWRCTAADGPAGAARRFYRGAEIC